MFKYFRFQLLELDADSEKLHLILNTCLSGDFTRTTPLFSMFKGYYEHPDCLFQIVQNRAMAYLGS